MKNYILIITLFSLPFFYGCSSEEEQDTQPNIVFILADDLGYGDVQFLNPELSKIPTPNIDKLAKQGMSFTDAHSSSSVCTPTRYGILTGRYNWRSRLQRGVSYSPTPLIDKDRLTFPSMLKQLGYATACIGKWHLGGFEWQKHEWQNDYSLPVTVDPRIHGFDWYFGVPIPGRPPHCFIENDRVTVLPTTRSTKAMHRWGGNIGPMAPVFTFESVLPTLTDSACSFIMEKAKTNAPYFLYLPLSSPHAPITPGEGWFGKSGLGRYADFVMETDAMVGRVLEAIEQTGDAENTLVVFTSDNGCTSLVGAGNDIYHKNGKVNKNSFKELEALGHFSSGIYRGRKASIWDGGHRIPCIVRWPNQVKPDTRSDHLICLNDFMATIAEITGAKIPDDAAEDSFSILSLLRGSTKPIRESLVHHSIKGNFAIREGKWKLNFCPGSGGWDYPTYDKALEEGLPSIQLYDMSVDMKESNNLQAEHPDVVKHLTKLLEKIVDDGRSTPGPLQKNDAPVDIYKVKKL